MPPPPTTTTCPKLVGRSGARGYPGSPSSPFHWSTVSKDLGTCSTSSKVASQDELKPGSNENMRVKAARSGISSNQVSTSFTRPPLARGDTWALVAPVKSRQAPPHLPPCRRPSALFLLREPHLKLPPMSSLLQARALGTDESSKSPMYVSCSKAIKF
jgi:hypothetical protein